MIGAWYCSWCQMTLGLRVCCKFLISTYISSLFFSFFLRWRFVIHGGIDGFSRIPVFISCSSNNKAETMLAAFKRGVLDFGLPSKVRSDKGGENVLVCAFMMAHPLRGENSNPFITGRSVHNQRIERLWRDVYRVRPIGFFTIVFSWSPLASHWLINVCSGYEGVWHGGRASGFSFGRPSVHYMGLITPTDCKLFTPQR